MRSVQADDALERLRAELIRDDETEGDTEPVSDADDVAARALGHLQAEDLHPLTHFLVSRAFAGSTSDGEEDRARKRVQQAVDALRQQQLPNPAEMLRKARESADLSVRDASKALGINEAAIERIERGRGTRSLLNLPAQSVADYVRQLGVNPRTLLAALWAIPQAEAVYGHTPRVSAEKRSELLRRAAAEAHDEDRKWAVDFLTWAERPS